MTAFRRSKVYYKKFTCRHIISLQTVFFKQNGLSTHNALLRNLLRSSKSNKKSAYLDRVTETLNERSLESLVSEFKRLRDLLSMMASNRDQFFLKCYSNDIEIYHNNSDPMSEIDEKFSHFVIDRHVPSVEVRSELLTTKNVVVTKRLPHGKFRYKIVIDWWKMDFETRNAIKQRIIDLESNHPDDVRGSVSFRWKNMTSTPFVYATEQMVSFIILQTGMKVNKILEYKLESEIVSTVSKSVSREECV